MYLTKSDFKVARTCGTKLYYRKLDYPSSLADDEYLSFLADGGYMVEEIARAKYPEGREMLVGSVDEGLTETQKAMAAAEVTLFEATFLAGQLLARLDILEKRGQVLRIIEVKAKSFNSQEAPNPFRGARGGIISAWQPYLEDIAFQTLVLRRLYPEATVIPCLCLVDKSATCNSDALFRQFVVSTAEPRGRPQVKFLGDRQALQEMALVQCLDVSAEVEELLPEVEKAAAEFARPLEAPKAKRIAPQLGSHCKNCEFHISQGAEPRLHGFRECWGQLANPEHHLLDLYRVDLLEKTGEFKRLIDSGSASLLNVREKSLTGASSVRQAMQLKYTRSGKEYIGPELPELLGRCPYPLHFLDFEASRLAVPYHAGMKPYEQVLFQWSCHTIAAPGSPVAHREWINIDDAYPNFEFTRTLQNALTPTGTVFVWSDFEELALKEVRKQLLHYGEKDAELDRWLAMMTDDNAGPIVDLLELARQYYFHPRMKGSLSIKDVLPAVWSSSEALRRYPWFSEYQKVEGGRQLDPYETLPELPFSDQEALSVRQGRGAMRTYQEMMYGARSHDAHFRNLQRQALLNYCKLDTAAMLMIWLKWTGQV